MKKIQNKGMFNQCLQNRSDKRFVNCPHLHKLPLRFSRLRQCLFLKLLRR